MKNKNTPKTDITVFSLAVPTSLYKRVKKIADEKLWSIAVLTRVALDKYCDSCENGNNEREKENVNS